MGDCNHTAPEFVSNSQHDIYSLKKAYKDLDWYHELNELGKRWVPNTPGMEVVWNLQLQQARMWTYVGICANCASDLEEFAENQDNPNAADEILNIMMSEDWYLCSDIRNYVPGKSLLGARMSSQISKRWKDAVSKYQKQPASTSMEDPLNPHTPEGPTVGAHIGSDPPETVDNDTAILLQVLVINFQNLRNLCFQDSRSKADAKDETIADIRRKALHYQLFFTEQIAYYAAEYPLPRQHSVDILKAFQGLYYRYFAANIEPDQKLTLSVIESTKLKRKCDVIPDSTDPTPLEWKSHGFLQYNVMMEFLNTLAIPSSTGTISRHRKAYINALQQQFHKTFH